MADSTSAVAASSVSGEDLARAEKFTFEPFVHEGEDAGLVLQPGTPRRRALDEALAEMDQGLDEPSVGWRQRYSLMLGLERLLSDEEPKLADGTLLNAHQADALSGTMVALMAELQAASLNGNSPTAPSPVDELPEDEDDDEDDVPDVADDPDDEWDDDAEDEDEDDGDAADDDNGDGGWDGSEDGVDDDVQLDEQPEDPNAARRFWFEHATGAGKTVAALGFVEGSRTGGILILTHRRNLVDQFHGELRDRGYAKRISP